MFPDGHGTHEHATLYMKIVCVYSPLMDSHLTLHINLNEVGSDLHNL